MEGFVSVLHCLDCGIPTDRNGVCVSCEKTIKPYRVRVDDQMWFVFCDGERVKRVALVRCHRCGCSKFSRLYEAEGTCWHCHVHNKIMPRVIGQWRFFQYHVTLAPCTQPKKNVIEEMDEDMARKFVHRNGIGQWIDEDESPQVGNIEEILDKAWQDATIPSSEKVAHYDKPGIARYIGNVSCLVCQGETTRIDKSCRKCGTENDIVIQRNTSGHLAVMNITRVKATGEQLIDELKVIRCFWHTDDYVTADLQCPKCQMFIDATMQQILTAKTIEGISHKRHISMVHFDSHTGERKKNAIKLNVPKAARKTASVSNGVAQKSSGGNVPLYPYIVKNPSATVSQQTSTGTQQSTALVRQPKQSPAVSKAEPKSKGIIKRVFGKSDRTRRRHTKAQRDAEYKRHQEAARRLDALDYADRKIAAIMTEQFGERISRSKVRRLLNKD
ncbi:MAG: hypothetical protein OXH65_06310 [Paracoccaceae bacterium]|nr:hypothetical protein [Paracoccaceae bacterium]